MKHIAILFGISILLTGCETSYNLAVAIFSEKEKGYLEDKENGLVRDCRGNLMGKEYYAPKFWQDNNLPKGTTRYVCKDGKAYLPNKVTDCQGANIVQKYGSVAAFEKRYNLHSVGNNAYFTCQNNQVTLVSVADW